MSMRALPYHPRAVTDGEASRATCRRGAERTGPCAQAHHRLQDGVPTTWALCSPCRHSPRARGDDPVVAPAPYPCHPHQWWDSGVVAVAVAARHRPSPERSPARALAGHGVARAVKPAQLAARIERPAKATCRWAAPGARHFLGFLSPRVNDSAGRPGILKP